MALIKPGIHENLRISNKTTVNEHGTLELYIEAAQSENAELEAFENNTVGINMASNFRFYPPNLTTFDKKPKNIGDLGEELRRMRYQLTQYALLYATPEQVEQYIGGTQMFEGLGIPPEDYGKAVRMLTQEDFLKKVVTNLANKFVKFLNDGRVYESPIKFRQKFLRQSSTKNYAVIPTSDFDVWLEPMTIPKASSKIAFSKWEIDNGKNNPNPAASSDAKNTTTQDVNTGKNLFGTPGSALPTTPKPDLMSQPVTPAEAIPLANAVPSAVPIPDNIPTAGTTITAGDAQAAPPITPATPAAAGGFFTK